MATVASAFITWPNPREIIEYEHDIHGQIVENEDGSKKILSSTPSYLAPLTEQEICDLVIKMWCDSKPGRIGAVTYCVSESGFQHLHMVLEVENSDSDRFTYQTVQKIYGRKFHIEPTRGTKKEAEDYIYKRGKYAEKGEKILAMAQIGDIKGNQGNRSDISGIESMLAQGLTPNEIMDASFSLRRYEKMIKAAYFRKRDLDTPFVRDVEVIYHVGEPESGKTYQSELLKQSIGAENVYFCTDYETGFLDSYMGERVLWLDEYRGQLKFSVFLSMLDKYKTQIHARYANVLTLWNEVHISTVLPPERIYAHMMSNNRNRDLDTYKQLTRRIHRIIYHYVSKEGTFEQYELPMKEYKDYETLKGLALGTCNKEGRYVATPEEEKYVQEYFM